MWLGIACKPNYVMATMMHSKDHKSSTAKTMMDKTSVKAVSSIKNNGLKNTGVWLGLSMNTTTSAIQQQIGHYLNVRYYGNNKFNLLF